MEKNNPAQASLMIDVIAKVWGIMILGKMTMMILNGENKP